MAFGQLSIRADVSYFDEIVSTPIRTTTRQQMTGPLSVHRASLNDISLGSMAACAFQYGAKT
jgi:hypothetical protein